MHFSFRVIKTSFHQLSIRFKKVLIFKRIILFNMKEDRELRRNTILIEGNRWMDVFSWREMIASIHYFLFWENCSFPSDWVATTEGSEERRLQTPPIGEGGATRLTTVTMSTEIEREHSKGNDKSQQTWNPPEMSLKVAAEGARCRGADPPEVNREASGPTEANPLFATRSDRLASAVAFGSGCGWSWTPFAWWTRQQIGHEC